MSGNAEAIAWICFALGALILLIGVWLGVQIKAPKTVGAAKANEKVNEAKEKVAALKTEAVASANAAPDAKAASESSNQGDAAESVLKEIGGIVSSLPEDVRFPALLMLIGGALISVATVQFGGHTLF